MEHFIDTTKISSTNFTHVFQVFSCEIINLKETKESKHDMSHSSKHLSSTNSGDI